MNRRKHRPKQSRYNKEIVSGIKPDRIKNKFNDKYNRQSIYKI